MGREETVSTCQLDFVMPERFDLNYVDADGKQKRPYILHRAPLSTHERMISFLIEFYGGAFPTWMAPVQVRLIPVNDELMDYAHSIESKLRASFFRTEVDYSAESFNKKIRNAVTQKIPNLWILGKKEMEEGVVTWRRHAVKEQQCLPLDKALSLLENVRDKRVMDNFPDVELG